MKRLKSYTSVWKVEKVLYGLQDVTLPVPLTFSQMGWLAGSEALVMFVLNKLPPLCYSDNFLLKWIVIPAGITWFMSKKTFDGKRPYSFLKSAAAYFLRPKLTYAGKKVEYKKQRLDETITIVRCEKVCRE